MKKIVIGLGVVVAVIVAAALIIPAVIPVDTYRDQVLARIEKATGREARIDGAFGFSILPNIEFTAGKVALANAPGASPKDMITLDRLNVRVALLPLLSGNLVIDSFVLEKPQIALAVDRNGRPNWRFGEQAAGKAPEGGAGREDAGGAPLSGLTLGDVRIIDGTLSYSDARSGTREQFDDVDMTVSLPAGSRPMKADGSLVWHKEKLNLALAVANPEAFLDGKPSSARLEISSKPVEVSFDGTVASGQSFRAAGPVKLEVPSLRGLAAWAGKPLDAPGNGFGRLAISGGLDLNGTTAAFSDAQIAFDDIRATGSLRVDSGGQRPAVHGRLAIATLDLNPYLPPEAAAPAGAGAGAAEGPGGWSDAPIDLPALRQFNGDFELTVDTLKLRAITIGKSRAKAALNDGRLSVDLTEMALYGGTGKAQLSADASQAIPAVGLVLAVSDVAAQPLLADAIDLDRLEGTANLSADVKARGKSLRQLISALDGSGKVAFANGAIRGINLAAMVRNLKDAFLNPEAGQAQKTDFSELSGSFTIKDGLVANRDLEMKSPLLRVSGSGTVNLPERTVNYRVEPKAVASLKGQGGAGDISGVMVPVAITGSWDNLKFAPDLGAVVRDNAMEQLQKALPPGAIGGALGGAKDGATGGTEGGTAPAKPLDQLKNLLGR